MESVCRRQGHRGAARPASLGLHERRAGVPWIPCHSREDRRQILVGDSWCPFIGQRTGSTRGLPCPRVDGASGQGRNSGAMAALAGSTGAGFVEGWQMRILIGEWSNENQNANMEWRKTHLSEKYSVSDEGRVRNDRTGKILKPWSHKSGHLYVALGHPKLKEQVHVLVLHAFAGPPP